MTNRKPVLYIDASQKARVEMRWPRTLLPSISISVADNRALTDNVTRTIKRV